MLCRAFRSVRKLSPTSPPSFPSTPFCRPSVQVIGPPLSSQAALLESVSTSYWGLPLVTPLAAAAHGEALESSSDDGARPLSFLVGVQPDVFAQMRALVTLILQMKSMRDAYFGR